MGNCSHCKRSIPQEYLSPLVSNYGNSQEICGICALALSNRELGIDRKCFKGEIAESLRQFAIEHYKITKQI